MRTNRARATAAIVELHSLLDSMKTVEGRQSIKLRISIIRIKNFPIPGFIDPREQKSKKI